MFLVILPVILTLAVGKGMSKPDFWSLELVAVTVSDGSANQLRADSRGKNENRGRSGDLGVGVAADNCPVCGCSRLATSVILRDLWGQFQLVYSPFSEWAIPILLIVGRHPRDVEPVGGEHLDRLLRQARILLRLHRTQRGKPDRAAGFHDLVGRSSAEPRQFCCGVGTTNSLAAGGLLCDQIVVGGMAQPGRRVDGN